MSERPVIAVGAVGGSGTRVVAQILREAGVFLGNDLNGAYDNLVFTRLFRNPDWHATATEAQKKARFELFQRYMSSGHLTWKDRMALVKAASRNKNFRSDRRFYARTLLSSRRRHNKFDRWGWKEPNTQIYIEDIARFIPGVRYIHVLRHGLDMAFSGNRRQLRSWGHLYDVHYEKGDSGDELASKMFRYWLRSTQTSIKMARTFLDGKHHIIRYEDLCKYPDRELRTLLEFCELEVDEEKFTEILKLPQLPQSSGRYLDHDLNFLENRDIESLEELGYAV
ncbi:MAG: sulfotransferase [Saprospiraceae bacterium]|nr:sulfotransferase [Saprospiraceae bacterium]